MNLPKILITDTICVPDVDLNTNTDKIKYKKFEIPVSGWNVYIDKSKIDIGKNGLFILEGCTQSVLMRRQASKSGEVHSIKKRIIGSTIIPSSIRLSEELFPKEIINFGRDSREWYINEYPGIFHAWIVEDI